jgi:hypothetical protein
MKICNKCRERKPLSDFHRKTKAADGRQNYCKCCNLRRLNADNAAKRGIGITTHSQRTRRRLRIEVLRAYGGETPGCTCCGEDKIEFLSVDHVGGGGSAHRKRIGASGLYTWLKREGFPPGFRILCHNCNQAIGHYGYCPHQERREYLLEIPRERAKAVATVRKKIVAAVRLCRDRHVPLTAANVAAAAGMPIPTVKGYRRQLFLAGLWPYHRNYPNGSPIRS